MLGSSSSNVRRTLRNSHLALLLALAVTLIALAPAAVFAEEGDPAQPAGLRTQEMPAERPALAPLDRWRAVTEEAKLALREPDTAARIAKLEEFLSKHPDHEDLSEVHETLAKSYLDTTGFDKARVAQLFEKVAADEQYYWRLLRMIDEHYLEHELPLDSAQRILDRARAKIDEERAKLEREQDEAAKRSGVRQLDYYAAQTIAADGMVRLVHGDNDGAIAAFDRAEGARKNIPSNFVAYDESGEKAFVLPTGGNDDERLARSLAALRSGNKVLAESEFGALRGHFSDPLRRAWLREVREGLGVELPPGVEITGAPTAAQNFQLTSLTGEKVALADYKGSVVLIAFWATWCGPCREELPILQKFADEHAQDGVKLLTINIDRFDARPSVQPFMEENGYRFPVLYEEPEQLTGYNYRAIPALYVVDRDGMIAEARTGYDPKFKEKLTGKVLDIARGKPTPGRLLARVEVAPKGWGSLWQRPIQGDVAAIAIAPPMGDVPGEIGYFGRNSFFRVDAKGQELGARPLQGWVGSLRAADLDGDFTREWVVGGSYGVKVLDDRGEAYWEHEFGDRTALVDVIPAQGAAMGGLVLGVGDEVLGYAHIPKERWKAGPFESVESVRAAGGGSTNVQTADGLITIDAAGKPSEKARPVPAGMLYSGRLQQGTRALDVFEGPYDPTPILDVDVDGNGEDDIVLLGRGSVRAYDAKGFEILRIDGDENTWVAAIGDLDGKPGAELVLAIRHYGLVALGRL